MQVNATSGSIFGVEARCQTEGCRLMVSVNRTCNFSASQSNSSTHSTYRNLTEKVLDYQELFHFLCELSLTQGCNVIQAF